MTPPLRRTYNLIAGTSVLHAVSPWLLAAFAAPPYSFQYGLVWALVMFWTWPAWLYLLIRHRAQSSRAFIAAVVLSVISLGSMAPGIFILTLMMGGAKT